MTNEVTDLIAALRDGSMSLDEAATRFRERFWPRRRKPAPDSYLEMAAAAQEDPEPYLPGSFDDAARPHQQHKIYDAQYAVLSEAQPEEVLAGAVVAGAADLPVADVGQGVLDLDALAQPGSPGRGLLALAQLGQQRLVGVDGDAAAVAAGGALLPQRAGRARVLGEADG